MTKWNSRLSVRAGVLFPPLAALAVGVWVISPRFSITGPSLIDDWDALISAPSDMHALVRLDYQVTQRFFPTWILWNWIQWRLPGAPGNMLGPNLAGVARLGLLVGGMTALSSIVVPRGARRPFEQALLCALPGLAIVTVPAFAQDLARFGPNEPALVGGMMLGGALLWWGGRELASERPRSPIRASVCTIAGFLAWCYGLFQKETSICVLLVLALAIPFGRDLARRLSRRQLTVGGSLLVISLLPIFVVLYEVIQIVQSGSIVYGAHVKTGTGAYSVLAHAFRVMQPSTQSIAGFVLLAIVLISLGLGFWQRRVDWIQLTILALALASLEMSVQTNVFESRYYLPTLALLAIGAARAVGTLPNRAMQRVILVTAAALALASAIPAHSMARTWATGDQLGDDLVAAARAHTNRGCNLTVSGIDYERSKAIAALVAYPHGHLSCSGVGRYAVLGPSAERSPQAECAPAEPSVLGEWNVSNSEPIQLVRCGSS